MVGRLDPGQVWRLSGPGLPYSDAPGSHPKTMSSPYLTGSLSSGKTPSWGCELVLRGGEDWLLLQDGRSSRDGGGHSASELPSKTMPTGHNWGSLLEKRRRKREEMKKPNVLHHRIIYSLQFCICCFASDSIKSNSALSVRTCLVPAAARSRWPDLWPLWRWLFL